MFFQSFISELKAAVEKYHFESVGQGHENRERHYKKIDKEYEQIKSILLGSFTQEDDVSLELESLNDVSSVVFQQLGFFNSVQRESPRPESGDVFSIDNDPTLQDFFNKKRELLAKKRQLQVSKSNERFQRAILAACLKDPLQKIQEALRLALELCKVYQFVNPELIFNTHNLFTVLYEHVSLLCQSKSDVVNYQFTINDNRHNAADTAAAGSKDLSRAGLVKSKSVVDIRVAVLGDNGFEYQSFADLRACQVMGYRGERLFDRPQSPPIPIGGHSSSFSPKSINRRSPLSR